MRINHTSTAIDNQYLSYRYNNFLKRFQMAFPQNDINNHPYIRMYFEIRLNRQDQRFARQEDHYNQIMEGFQAFHQTLQEGLARIDQISEDHKREKLDMIAASKARVDAIFKDYDQRPTHTDVDLNAFDKTLQEGLARINQISEAYKKEKLDMIAASKARVDAIFKDYDQRPTHTDVDLNAFDKTLQEGLARINQISESYKKEKLDMIAASKARVDAIFKAWEKRKISSEYCDFDVTHQDGLDRIKQIIKDYKKEKLEMIAASKARVEAIFESRGQPLSGNALMFESRFSW